ncbi:hypothetical protein [Natronobeatus ordinarius]|uniref:hypothetical protein n=1 Tax=Natronobeatus ordinarius TaxID=2963433 RepID=UPI0020CED691|nr:hypothetical protein [Natronobeatus ordinarius]
MTTGPSLRLGKALVPGVLAVALFGLMALIVVNTGFGSMRGFPEGISVTSEIGYALLDLTTMQSTEGAIGGTERFLVSFILIAIVLDAALDASLVLAKREEEGEPVTALSSAPSDASSGAAGGRQAAANGGTRSETADAGGEDA